MKFRTNLVLLLLLSLYASIAKAGNYPFPQSVEYSYGQKPANALPGHALLAYESWKTKYYNAMPDNTGRVYYNEVKEVVSEGIAYGMLLAVYADDQEVFDRLWRYYKKHSNNNGIMHWKIGENDKIISTGGATDAEEDAAMALIVANDQWGSNGIEDYHTDALKLIDAIMKYEVEAGTYRLKSGDGWGLSQVTNPSYFAPAYYKVFYEITGNADWLKVVEKCYEILALNADPTTGLVSDWCDEKGNQAGTREYGYTYDASRFPWRMATDYLWYGDERAGDYCNKMSAFVQDKLKGSKGINGSGYTKSGSSKGGGHSPVFVSTFALTGMGSDPKFQTHLNDSYTDNFQTESDEYFGATLRAISLMMLTGNFYKAPKTNCASPNLGQDVSLCEFPNLVLTSGIEDETNRKFIWSNGSTGNSLAISEPGKYWLKSDSLGCVRTDTVLISKFQISLGPDKEININGEYLSASPISSDIKYTWSTGETTQSIFIEDEGIYWVEADSAGCIDSDTIVISKTKPIAKNLFPNPSKGAQYKIYIPDNKYSNLQIHVYNPNGNKVNQFDFQLNEEDELFDINLSGLNEGLYILKMYFVSASGTKNESTQKIFVY